MFWLVFYVKELNFMIKSGVRLDMVFLCESEFDVYF